MKPFFFAEFHAKNTNRLIHLFAKDRRYKMDELQAIAFDEEFANDTQKISAVPKHLLVDVTAKDLKQIVARKN